MGRLVCCPLSFHRVLVKCGFKKMKFGKEFNAQMAPEWQTAYMDYNFLKKQLKEIQRFYARNRPPTRLMKRNPSLYRTFSGLIQRQRSEINPTNLKSSDVESQVAVVNSVAPDVSQRYGTRFLMTEEEGEENELVFFRRLNDEFNKVDRFYRSKVEEVLKEADELTRQMNALIAFRIKVKNPNGWANRSDEISRLSSDVAASSAALSASTPSGARAASSKYFWLRLECQIPTSGVCVEVVWLTDTDVDLHTCRKDF